MGIYSETIQRLYVAYFNRPADPPGLTYWEQAIAAANGSTAAVSAAFAASDEYKAAYAGMDASHVVNQVYVNLFGHDADGAGRDFWTKALENKQMTIDDVVTQIAHGAQGADLVAFDSKTAAATAFSNALDTVQEVLVYSGDHANQIAKTFLAGVIDETTLQAAIKPDYLQKVIDGMSGTGPWPLPFSFTSGVDHFVGTAGNDVYNAFPFNPANGFADITMSAYDSVDGGAGADILNIQIVGGRNTSFGTIKNIETINISADVPTDIDASALTGVTMLRQIGVAGEVSELGTATVAAFQGKTIAGPVNVSAAGASTTVFFEGVSDSASLAVSGATLNAITVSGSRVHDGTGSPAPLNMMVTAGTNVPSIKVNTDQATKLTVAESASSATHLTSMDASASAGSIIFDATLAPMINSVKTGAGDDIITATKVADKQLIIQAGAGNDRVYLSGAPAAGDIINGGSGNNTLVISGVDANQAAAISKLVTNFSAIQFVYPDPTSNLDASQLSSSYGVIDMYAGGAVYNVTTQSLFGNGSLTATVAGYDGEGAYGGGLQITQKSNGTITANADKLDLTVQAIASDITTALAGDLRTATVNLSSDKSHLASVSLNTTGGSLAALSSVVFAGNGEADVSNADGTSLVTVTATALGGDHGLTYVSDNSLSEAIRLGAGVDHLTLRASTFQYTDAVYGLKLVLNSAGVALAAESDHLSVAGVSSLVKLFTTNQTDIDLALREAAASAKGDDLVFVLNGDTYIYHDNGNNLIDWTDTLVKLVGVTDTRAVIVALGGTPG